MAASCKLHRVTLARGWDCATAARTAESTVGSRATSVRCRGAESHARSHATSSLVAISLWQKKKVQKRKRKVKFIVTMHGSDPSVVVRLADQPADIAAVKACFTEYTAWLDEDISFQNYDAEFTNLPGKYAPPTGVLLLAVDAVSDEVLGCIAVRALHINDAFLGSRGRDAPACELKRLYVYPRARGRQVARRLMRAAVKRATDMGYVEMLLDTLPKMQPAIKLYESEGFRAVEPYYESPLRGTLFLSRQLGAE